VEAAKDRRPTYVGRDLGALAEPQTSPEVTDDAVTLGGWTASVEDGELRVEGDGSASDWWRVVAVAAWRHLDDTGQPVETGDVQVPQ
jgi:hypothetical protein